MKRTYRPDPKPASRKRTPIRKVDKSASARAMLAHPACMCGKRAASAHHVVPRGGPHFGDDVMENLVPLCGSGTTGCHGAVEDGRHAAREALGRHIVAKRPDVIAYVIGKLGDEPGRAWLERTLGVIVV